MRLLFTATAMTLIVCFGLVGCRSTQSKNDTDTRACSFEGEPSDQAAPGVEVKTLVKGIKNITKIGFAPGNNDLFVAQRHGFIFRIQKAKITKKPLLDLRSRMPKKLNTENGLLSFVFHPDFEKNRKIYVTYSPDGPPMFRLSSFVVGKNDEVDLATEKMLFQEEKERTNHNGGDLAFGPDGFLYISVGDGHFWNDPNGHGQNLADLRGSVLRLDVNRGDPYTIPTDNPQWQTPNAKREIWAYGLRNPWRMTFDRQTGDLWVGDVGLYSWEEINRIVKGGNYGWRFKEGNACRQKKECRNTKLIDPFFTYGRNAGVSVIGGYVYRGKTIPSLTGNYIFTDYGSGILYAIESKDQIFTKLKTLIYAASGASTFGEDHEGELYLGNIKNASIEKLVPAVTKRDRFPRLLSETKCFLDHKTLKPRVGMHPYQVNTALWSDGADKERFVYVPKGSQIVIDYKNRWQIPEGTVFVKNFILPQASGKSKIIETRFLVKRSDKYNHFSGYTYQWKDDGSDAVLLSAEEKKPYHLYESKAEKAIHYYFPSRSDCQLCHNSTTQGVLGFVDLQIHRGSELKKLMELGVVVSELKENKLLKEQMVDHRDQTRPIEARARSYLHAQCAHCHNSENQAGQTDFDFRFTTPLSSMFLCDKDLKNTDLGFDTSVKLLRPGDPQKSAIFLRMAATEPKTRMPPLATARVDELGKELVHDWISGLKNCN